MALVPSASIPSGNSRNTLSLLFVNNSSKKVNILWVDNFGGNRYYGTLEPHRYYDANYFEKHPWICEDAVTKKRMQLNGYKTLYPVSTSEGSSSNPSPEHPRCYLPVVPTNGRNGGGTKRSSDSGAFPGPSCLCGDTSVRKKIPKSTSKGSTSTLHPRALCCHFPVISKTSPNGEQMTREYVSITLPVFTLQELSSEVITDSICKEDIEYLNIPASLKLTLFKNYLKH